MSKGWNDSMLKKLKALVGKGLSTAEMGKKLGMSKNAVVGKLNRLGWNAKANDVASKSAKKPAKTAKAPVKATKASATKTVSKKTVKVPAKNTKTPTKAKTATKTSVKKEKAPLKKVSAKKPEVKKTAVKPNTKVEKKETKKAVKPVEMPVIKTASKKTKKDLASHELYIEHAKKMAELKPNQCRWPIGDPDSNNFRFCGETVFPGKPYCYEHCRQAYQFAPVKKK